MKRIKELFLRSHPPPVLSVSICSPISKSAESQTATPIPSPSPSSSNLPSRQYPLPLKTSAASLFTYLFPLPLLLAIQLPDNCSLYSTIITDCLQSKSIPSKALPAVRDMNIGYPVLCHLNVRSITILLIDPYVRTLPLATSMCRQRPAAVSLSQSDHRKSRKSQSKKVHH
jgi:hypothetical protein